MVSVFEAILTREERLPPSSGTLRGRQQPGSGEEGRIRKSDQALAPPTLFNDGACAEAGAGARAGRGVPWPEISAGRCSAYLSGGPDERENGRALSLHRTQHGQ